MKNVIFLLALILTTAASSQPYQSKAYKTGNYIFCGKEFPRHFAYLIERKSPGENKWSVVARLKYPGNSTECKSTIMMLPASLAELTAVNNNQIEKIWERSQPYTFIDSLYGMAFDPRYQAALGCGWFDDGLLQKGEYTYRVSRIPSSGEPAVLQEIKISYPGAPFTGTLKPLRYRLNSGIISISFQVTDTVNTAGVKIFRSPYKSNKFTEIKPEVFFSTEDRKTVAVVTDYSALKEVTYSYLALPYDLLGNPGKMATDTLNVYNFTKSSDLGIIERFDAVPEPEKKGVSLSWQLKNTLNVTSVDIFRSASYDGRYDKIASLPAKVTEYFDHNELKPATAYYYYIKINNGFGSSLPSARVPVILKGTKQNFLPPQNLTIEKKGNIVTLRFRRLDPESRGYYVYRANGYVAPMQQLPTMLLSADSLLVYHDTLPLSSQPAVYSYAVASVNSSYNISPLTERVSVAFSGGMLPIPSKVIATLYGNHVFVIWDQVAEQNAAIASYRVFRSVVSEDDSQTAKEQLVAALSYEENSYTDSLVSGGTHYRYRVQSVCADTNEVSGLSLPAGVSIPDNRPLLPGQVYAFASEKSVLLQWDLPSDSSLSGLRVYRATAGQQATLLKELPASDTQYEDLTAQKGITYFYYLTALSKTGKESEPTDATSARIR